MNREDKLRQRQALWSQPRMPEEPVPSVYHERDQALVQLMGTPGWEALRSLILANTKFEFIQPDDPAWETRLMRRQFRSELAMELVMAVEKSAERVAKQQAKKSQEAVSHGA